MSRVLRVPLAVLGLCVTSAISCSDFRTTEPSNRAVPQPDAVPAPVFVVDPAPIEVPTYDGSGQAVHPDVVEFGSAWHGSRYWLTITPYPKSNQHLENPSILTSDNGTAFGTPMGLANPVIRAPQRSRDYNSDPELVYEQQTNRLVLFDRLVEKNSNTLRVSTSTDGVHWTAPRDPFWQHGHTVVSPTVAARVGQPARMWYVDAGKKGCDATSTRVMMRIGSDSNGKVVDTRWVGPAATNLSIPGYAIWHIKARWVPEKSEYWMLLSAFPLGNDGCHTDDLFFARSTDGSQWTVYSVPILRHGDRQWTAATVYRSSFVYDAANDALQLWISARDAAGDWHVGYARARYSAMLAALKSGHEVSTRIGTTFNAPMLAGDQP